MKVIGSVELHPPFFLLLAIISIHVTLAVAGVLSRSADASRIWFQEG